MGKKSDWIECMCHICHRIMECNMGHTQCGEWVKYGGKDDRPPLMPRAFYRKVRDVGKVIP